MRIYEGTKRLKAERLTRGEYNAYRGWPTPANEDEHDDGYLVEYLDGGKPNDSRHAGYISWSPKDVFERTYKEVVEVVAADAWKQRVRDEEAALDRKLIDLAKFVTNSPAFADLPLDARTDLNIQYMHMYGYAQCLRNRIARFDALKH